MERAKGRQIMRFSVDPGQGAADAVDARWQKGNPSGHIVRWGSFAYVNPDAARIS